MFADIFLRIANLLKEKSYSQELNDYILDRRPQTVYDVERLTQEYNKRLAHQCGWNYENYL